MTKNLEYKLSKHADVSSGTSKSVYGTEIDKNFIETELEMYLVGAGLKPAFFDPTDKFSSKLSLIHDRAKQYGIEYILIDKNYHFSIVGGTGLVELINSIFSKNDERMGLALGYPKKAVKYFSENPKKSTAKDNLFRPMIEAKKAGKKIPYWLAYLSHVPEKLDIINGDIPESSRRLGRMYMNYVRKNNPHLAKETESYFDKKVERLCQTK